MTLRGWNEKQAMSPRGADLLPAPVEHDLRAEAARGVLDERHAVFPGDRAERTQIARHAHLVNAEYRPRPRRDRRLHQLRIHVEALRVDIDEDGGGTAERDGVRRRYERVAHGDDLVAGSGTDRE